MLKFESLVVHSSKVVNTKKSTVKPVPVSRLSFSCKYEKGHTHTSMDLQHVLWFTRQLALWINFYRDMAFAQRQGYISQICYTDPGAGSGESVLYKNVLEHNKFELNRTAGVYECTIPDTTNINTAIDHAERTVNAMQVSDDVASSTLIILCEAVYPRSSAQRKIDYKLNTERGLEGHPRYFSCCEHMCKHV